MQNYLDTLRDIVTTGQDLLTDRTGVGRRRKLGTILRFNVQEGFPLVTTRAVNFDNVVTEQLAFLKGSNQLSDLEQPGQKVWSQHAVSVVDIDLFIDKYIDPSASEQWRDILKETLIARCLGSIGQSYGTAFRRLPVYPGDYNHLWPKMAREDLAKDRLAEIEAILKPDAGDVERTEQTFHVESHRYVDQMQRIITGLKKDPFSNWHVMTAWIPTLVPFLELSVAENIFLGKAGLPACCMTQHYMVTLGPTGEKYLSMALDQRSCDFPVGGPHNVAFYALLLSLVAKVVGMVPYELIWKLDDYHVYLNQLDKVEEQLLREPRPLPTLWLNPEIDDLFSVTSADIEIRNYDPHPAIRYKVAK